MIWVIVIKSLMVGIWDYIWLMDMLEGQYILIVEVIDGVGNKMMGMFDFIIDIMLLMLIIELVFDQDIGQNKNDNLISVIQLVFVLGSIDKDV